MLSPDKGSNTLSLYYNGGTSIHSPTLSSGPDSPLSSYITQDMLISHTDTLTIACWLNVMWRKQTYPGKTHAYQTVGIKSNQIQAACHLSEISGAWEFWGKLWYFLHNEREGVASHIFLPSERSTEPITPDWILEATYSRGRVWSPSFTKFSVRMLILNG